ncbi:hypothetical protein FHETE_4034 [Fusarium heterosporum]|uniref:Heterokaryon incompatibility domain-containing protein n=1 Tax=Fusarium heterosporum TaxID=42747 RepID=A0A8H5TGA4_FUSHE|nr:hypothetical protein FHETE_4034 [Fusarium heterosporum]
MAKDSTIDPDSQETRLEILSVQVQQRGAASSTFLPISFNYTGQNPISEAYQGPIWLPQDPTSDVGLENITRLTLKWIQDCQNTHNRCGHGDNHGNIDYLPTRLIDVGTDDEKQPPKLFLPDGSKNLEYVALSYAWGPVNNHVTKTTASNLQVMMEGLPFSQLPKTVQDAIIFTRKLGFQYLWVDALCILQSRGPDDEDHKADWSHEATCFGYYYQNAMITISATGAKSADDGLFLSRPALSFDPKPVTFRRQRPSGEIRHVSILPKVPSWVSEMKRAPLYERGWAIQERILSTRVVHFSTNMVLWECQERRATEIDYAGSSPRDNGMIYEEVSDFMPVFWDIQRNGAEASQAIYEWYSFVEGYTAAKFTFIGDRLPALSGISTLIQKHIAQKYGAGLWELAIPQGLAWFLVEESVTNTSHLTSATDTRMDFQLILPSWSWAASRGPVKFLSLLDTWETMLKVENWEVKSVGVDTSGQVLRARLKVRGVFKIINLKDLIESRCQDFESGTSFLGLQSKIGHLDFARAVYMDAEVGAQCGSEVHPCVLVGTTYVPGSSRTKGPIACALILEPAGLSGGSEEYRRIGFLCVPLENWSSKDLEEKVIELV